ncbi:flippase-like domain-containing protein [Gemmata sp. G18]|uniref:Flippase-like domain-containing protein n=1 Tax=Gemmata palustris TaxID=2822762 RepID=A0ABS5BYS1_9BACT|nr:lysylphosphatidylglycerol synthase transmembrane domain-containing protein [Gemmata palustris]MBP3958891.1 flippase-like domain-containing protein [Gemmata palustris]
MKKHAVQWLVPFLKYGVGFGLLAYVIYKYWGPQNGGPGIGQLLQGPIAYEWLIAAALLLATTTGIQLYRWYLLVRALDLPTSVRNAYRLGLVGVYYNTFFPGSVGGDLLKAYFIAKAHPERKTRAVASVIADRAMGLFGLILFVAVSGSIAWALGDARITNNADLQRIVTITAGIASGSIVGFLALGLLPTRRVDRFAARLKWVPKIGTSLAEMWYAVWMYRQRLKVVVLGVCISAVAHCALVLSFHCASRVFPPNDPAAEPASLSEHFVIAPIGFIVQAIPISPGGVGVGEAAFAWLYKISDRPEMLGVVARLSLRLVEWLLGIIGYIVFLRMRAEVVEVQHEMEEEQDQETASKEQGKAEVK